MSDKLKEIEKQFDFQYPNVYHQLHDAGMLNLGEAGPQWWKTVFPELKKKPPLLLFGKDFGVLLPDEVADALAEITDPSDYRHIKPEMKFIPFGRTEAGDLYCFYITEQSGRDIPIVLLNHDVNEVEYLAKNLPDFVMASLINSVEAIYPDDLIMDGSLKENLQAIISTHNAFLLPQHQPVIAELYSRELIDYEVPSGKKKTEIRQGLLTEVALRQMLAEQVPYKKTGETFAYSND